MTAKGSLHKDAIRNVGYEIETRLLIYLKLTKSHKNHENHEKSTTDFWNQNQNNFICKANTHYGKKHLFKVVIDMQMYTPVLLDYFFQEDRKQLFEVNAYEIVNGKPETLLDYLVDIKMGFNISQSYNIPEINALIEIIEDEYGALRGKDLVIIPK